MESRLGGLSRAMSSTVAPEVVLAGRYRLVRRLASGGMGQVWRANDEILGRPVAVKLLRSEYAEDPEFVDRFRAEARRTAALSHPGIASVFDYGETGDPENEGTTAYLVMELVEGEPLSALLAREGRLSPAHALDVLAQAALALDSAHLAGVVHRDVKPSNLLLRRDGVVKVTDFGIAHAADEAPRTEAGLVVGTAAYLSPEQVACRPATPASDVYALGVVAYECLAGRRPFTGDHPIALALAHRRSEPPPLPEDVPEAICELVTWTLSKAPSARPHSAGALGRQALVARTTLDEQDDEADPQTPPGGWFPVMSGWHPALGRGREPGSEPEVERAAPGARAERGAARAERRVARAERGRAEGGGAQEKRGGAHAEQLGVAARAAAPPRAGVGASAAEATGAMAAPDPNRDGVGPTAAAANGISGAGKGAAAAGRPAGAPARAERDAAGGHQPRANGTTGTRADGPSHAAARNGRAGGHPRAPANSTGADQRLPAGGAGGADQGAPADRRQRDRALETTGEWAPSPLLNEHRAGAAEPAAPASSARRRPAAPPGRSPAPVDAAVGGVGIPGSTGTPRTTGAQGRRRRGSVVTAVVVITALLVGGALAAARQRSYAVVPSVDGQALTVAGQALTSAGFEVREQTRPNATVRAGLVISQQPAAGARRTKGTLVTMVVSSGPRVLVLNPARYLGRSLAPVRAAMIRLGLQVSVTGTLGRTGSGRVIGISPSGTLHQGDEVTVTVATGRHRAAGA
jgi:hypothetical protein